jgi:hypothetical protein
MKIKRSLVIIVFLTLGLYACKKDESKPSIIGKWNVVSDSTYVGAAVNNHLVAYNGMPGDYFNFNANGSVYTKEGASLNILPYKLVSDTTIDIQSFAYNTNGTFQACRIATFTAHSLIIEVPKLITFGGTTGRRVSLSR